MEGSEKSRMGKINQVTPLLEDDLSKQKHAQEKSGHDHHDPHIDHLTQLIGEVGPWQLFWMTILCIPVIFHAWQMLANKFLTYPTDHWCARPEGFKNMSVPDWRNFSAPQLPDGSLDRCHVFLADYQEIEERPDESTPTVQCHTWEYDTSLFKNTAIQRWDLVCGRSWIPRAIQMLFFLGNFLGVLLAGHLSDKFGRKHIYMGFLTVWICFGVAGAFVDGVVAWAICRFVCGACSLAYNTVFAVFAVELTHGKWRSILGHFFGELVWNLGIMTLGALVYFVRDMVHLELIIGLSAVPWLPLWYYLFESPRWLLAKGRTKEAIKVLEQACKANKKSKEGIEIFVGTFKQAQLAEGEKKEGYLSLLKLPGMRRNTIIVWFCWFSFSMGYFGLLYNTPALNWNPFLVFVFPSFIVSGIAIIQPFIENKLGRKLLLTGSLLLAGTTLLLTVVIRNSSTGVIVCAWIGTVACSVAFGVGYTYTKELYPTIIRTTALSTASASARIGSILSPFIGMLDSISDVIPLMAYGIIVFGAGVASLWVWPETKAIKMPESLQECEKLAMSRNTWVQCCKSKKKGEQEDT